MSVWSHGGCQLEEARVQLFSLPKFDADLASAHSVRGEVALPRVASDEHCVSDAIIEVDDADDSVRMYGDSD